MAGQMYTDAVTQANTCVTQIRALAAQMQTACATLRAAYPTVPSAGFVFQQAFADACQANGLGGIDTTSVPSAVSVS